MMPEIELISGNETVPESQFFGKYEIGKLLGYGAFAKVYHARNVQTNQSVAIKVVSKQKVLKGGLTAQIKTEISIMSRLKHPHIMKLLEVLATKTKIYFVMEFAKGGELFAKVSKGRFSEDLSRKYFHQLISAVGYCHSKGIFHRDLKPENLLFDENWDLKVSDFGLSAVTDRNRVDGLLHTLCGTPAYVAPEILTKKGYDGAKVDVWSCGVILFVLIAGYLPFNDTNLMGLYRKIYKGEFRCPKWTSPELKHLLSKLLDTNPLTRITMNEIIQDPWFRKGYNEIKFDIEDFDLKEHEERNIAKRLNAFDIISFSSGFDLSGMFSDSNILIGDERFLSGKSPAKIIEKIEEISNAENIKLTKKKDGNFIVVVEIFRLTDELVVVEVKKKAFAVEQSDEIWNDKLRPQLTGLIYSPETSISGA